MLVRFWQWLKYYVTAANSKGHGVHSPFVYSFIDEILLDKRQFYAFESIGKVVNNISSLKIEETICNHPYFTDKKYLELLFKIINFYKPKKVVEIGEIIGISTAYALATHPNLEIVIEENNRKYIQKISSYLPEIMIDKIKFENDFKNVKSLDFIILHQLNEEAFELLQQFVLTEHQALFVFIHQPYYNKESVNYWGQIKEEIAPIISIDLFSVALVYIKKELLQTEHFKVRY